MAALLVGLALTTPGRSDAATDVALSVAPARVATGLEPIAVGLAYWIETQLEAAGLDVKPLPERTDAASAGDFDPQRALAAARSVGADHAVWIDLERRPGEIEVLLRVERVADGALRFAARHAAPSGMLHVATSQALLAVQAELGVPPERTQVGAPFDIGDLAELGEAVQALDAGRHVSAARALAALPEALTESLRTRLRVEAAAADRTSQLRLRVQQGEADAVWQEILREASENLYGEDPDPDILLVAGEIQYRRGKLHEAQAYFERSLEVRDQDFDAVLGLAQALGDQQDEAGADAAFARARALRPDSLRLRIAMANVPSEDPAKGARAALDAALALAQVFDRHRAEPYFARAIALDQAIEGEVLSRRADFEFALGDDTAALASGREATESAPGSAMAWRGLARTLHALADDDGARDAYRRALEIDPNDATSQLAFARFQIATGQGEMTRPALEALSSANPPNPEAMRLLASLMRDAGELEPALALLGRAEALAGSDAQALRVQAAIELARDDATAASATLERALRLEPSAPDLREALAGAYTRLDRGQDAERQHQLAIRLGGGEARATLAADPAAPAQARPRSGPFDKLVSGFGLPTERARRAVLVGVELDFGWTDWLLSFAMPRRLDADRLTSALGDAIAVHYERIEAGGESAAIDRVHAALLDRAASDSIVVEQRTADLAALDADVAFAARVAHGTPLTPSQCADASQLYVELIRLGGDPTLAAQSQHTCVPAGVARFSVWNESAGLLALALLIALVMPLLRGRGEVEVRVKLPVGGRPRLKLALTATGTRTRTLPVEDGEPVRFTRIPARRGTYMVRLTGTLEHAETGQMLTEVSTERPVLVERGDSVAIDFDLVRHASIIEVAVQDGPHRINSALIALRNQPSSLRPVSDGLAHLYLEPGQHGLVVGVGDRVLVFDVSVRQGRRVELDVGTPTETVFKGCTSAVLPYMEGDLARAIDALDEALLSESASRVRAQWHGLRGETADARAANAQIETLRRERDPRGAAQTGRHDDVRLTRAGTFEPAADPTQSPQALVESAQAFESSGDYESAAACYRQLGDLDAVLGALEKANDHFDAARVALDLKDTERALENLGRVPDDDARYAEACWTIGSILAGRGEAPYALDRFDAAHKSCGLPGLPIAMLDCYARLLEASQRHLEARAALRELRRRDGSAYNVDVRLEAIDTAIERTASTAPEPVDVTPAAVQKRPVKLRLKPTPEQRPEPAPPVAPVAPAAPPAAAPPAERPRYVAIETIGESPLGTQVKSTDTQSGETVVVHWVCDAICSHRLARKHFMIDADAAKTLEHPNVLPTLDTGVVDGRAFATWTLLDGASLDRVLARRGRLAVKIVAQLGVQAATALHFAHRRKVLHLDVRPAQLFLTRDRIVRLTGFGFGSAIDVLRHEGTDLRAATDWRAPERTAGALDASTDLFDLGVTLFELVTGARPDLPVGSTPTASLDPRREMHDIPGSLADLIVALTEPDPSFRPALAKDVVRSLQTIIRDIGG